MAAWTQIVDKLYQLRFISAATVPLFAHLPFYGKTTLVCTYQVYLTDTFYVDT